MYAGFRWLIVLYISSMSLCRFFLCIEDSFLLPIIQSMAARPPSFPNMIFKYYLRGARLIFLAHSHGRLRWGQEGQLPTLPSSMRGQKGQELPFILSSFHLFYPVKGHFLALWTVWFEKIQRGTTMRPIY